MNTLFLSATNSYLAERWLQTHPEQQEVTLVVSQEARDVSAKLQFKYPHIHRSCPLGEAFAPQTDAIVVPCAVEMTTLHYFPSTTMPELNPFYPLLKELFRMGFRRFELYGLHGSFDVRIPYLLEDFRDKHKGQRCFVVGNGPSLNQLAMHRLKDEITLGSNRCFLGYEQWGFQFTYWGIYDHLQIEAYAGEYETSVPRETVKFAPVGYLPLLQMEHLCPVSISIENRPQFSHTPEWIGAGYTVTYMLLQLAALMGCDPIILIGTDHRYDLKESAATAYLRHVRERMVRPFRDTFLFHAVRTWRQQKERTRPLFNSSKTYWVSNDSQQPTHFTSQYTQGEQKRFVLPQPLEAEQDFACAQRWAVREGRQILNATPGTGLKTFPLVDYETLF